MRFLVTIYFLFLADPGKARGCSTSTLFIESLIDFLKFKFHAYGTAKLKRLDVGLLVMKIDHVDSPNWPPYLMQA